MIATPEQWQKVKMVLAGALEREPSKRSDYLDQACTEPSVRREVESLILAHDQTNSRFLELPAVEEATLKSGTRLGSYEILELLGAGGMGEVYKAHDTKLMRDVAIKVLPAAFVNDSDRLSRFQREARILASLNHPNIATLHGLEGPDQSGGMHYLVMELVPGQTLAERLSAGGLGIEQALEVAGQIAGALEAAHGKGVIHRDLKPANVKVTPEGRVKVLDFGLAKAFTTDGGQDFSKVPTLSSMGSGEGRIVGTPAYMSPEQAQGKHVDKRTDIWSFGCLLYELLTGQRAFRGENTTEILAKILEREPDWQALPSVTPAKVRELLLRCLQKEPQRRLQDIREAQTEITGAQREGSTGPVPVPVAAVVGRRVRILATTLLAVIVLGIGLAAIPTVRERMRSWLGIGAIPRERQLAVLPFQVVGGDASAKAFSDGLTEMLTAKLTQLTARHALQVVPASDVRARNVTSSETARQELGVNLILTGSLQQSQGMSRVTYELVDTKSGRQLRADTITMAAADPFAGEDQVVESVLRMLELELQPAERQNLGTHGTQVAGAYDFYLQGLGYLQNYDKAENLQNAFSVFQRALAMDPNYASAYTGLGQTYWLKYYTTKEIRWVQPAREACQRALALDESLSPAHVCLGTLAAGTGQYEEAVTQFDRSLETEPTSDDAYRGLALAYQRLNKLADAERTYRRAIELRPQYWAGYSWLGALYFQQARYPEAAEMFNQVVALVPDSFNGYSNLGAIYIQMGRYAEAITTLQRSVSIRPGYAAYSNLATAYFHDRRFAEAARTYEQALMLNAQDYRVWGNLGDAYYWASGKRSQAANAYQRAIALVNGRIQVNPRDPYLLSNLAGYRAKLGQRAPALEALQKALDIAPADPEVLFRAALVHSQLGETSATLDWLEKAEAAGYSTAKVMDSPDFNALKPNARFQELFRRKSP